MAFSTVLSSNMQIYKKDSDMSLFLHGLKVPFIICPCDTFGIRVICFQLASWRFIRRLYLVLFSLLWSCCLHEKVKQNS